jgi:hypothetical protein
MQPKTFKIKTMVVELLKVTQCIRNKNVAYLGLERQNLESIQGVQGGFVNKRSVQSCLTGFFFAQTQQQGPPNSSLVN